MDKMKGNDKIKCSAVVDRARGRAGPTGTEMLTEMLEWRTDRRDLSVQVKIIGVNDIMCQCGLSKSDGFVSVGSLLALFGLFDYRARPEFCM